VQAVILTAGRGDRLRPVTDHVPKPLIPFWGKPFVAYLLDTLVGLVDDVVIVVAPDGAVRAALGESWLGLPLRYAVQPTPGGTGDALLHARELLDERFLLMLGDTLATRETVQAVLARQGDAVLTLTEVDDPHNHASVGIYNGLVVEHLWVEDSPLVDVGMTLLPRMVCDYLDGLRPRRGELRVLQGVEALLADGRDVRAVKMPGPWLQYGDHEGVAGVCRVMNDMKARAEQAPGGLQASIDVPHQNCEITNSVVFGPGELHDCSIRNSLVYCNGRIEGHSAQDEIAAWGCEA